MRAADFLAAVDADARMPLGPEVRATSLTPEAVAARVAALTLPAARRDHLLAAALLVHDRLEASHALSQRLDDADAAWLHGIMHRREPDDDNARYWFARVGDDPLLASLAARARAADVGDGRRWADDFIAAAAAARDGRRESAPLVALQADELAALIGRLLVV